MKKGFTLIELLVVIAIIGILSSVVLASLNSAREKARDARRVSDMGQLSLALEMYYNDNTAYPVAATYALLGASLAPTYLPVMPTDPGSNNYGYIGTATDYCLSTAIENAASVPDNNAGCTAQVTVPVANYTVAP